MKILYIKDKNRRNIYALYEQKKLILKSISQNFKLPKKTRNAAYLKLISLPKDSSITKIRNRCVITNRPRAVYKKFKMSRLMFRKLALQGRLIGIKKASW